MDPVRNRAHDEVASPSRTAGAAISNGVEVSALVRAFKKGDRNAFGGIYDEYAERIYRFFFSRTANKELSEDLTSDTFRKALEHLADYKEGKGSLTSWLYTIARNTLTDHWRTAKGDAPLDEALELGASIDMAGHADAKEQLAKVKAYLTKLSADERQVVLLRVWDELSYAEIAETMGRTEGSAKMLFSRTVQKMRRDLPFAAVMLFLINRIH